MTHTAYGGLSADVPNTPDVLTCSLLVHRAWITATPKQSKGKQPEIKQLRPYEGSVRPLLFPNAHRKRLTKRAKVDRRSGDG
jgi:hypothetical protein